MANTIKVKRSATQSAIPTTGQLELGELAINTYDGKLFIKKDNGTASVVEIGAGAGSGTVTSVAALTLGTTGTDLSSTVANSTTTPVITLQVPTASATNRGALSSTDWTTFNNKGSGSVTSVSATVPSVLSISGSPITTSGTLAITYSGTALPVANGGTGTATAFTTGSVVFAGASGTYTQDNANLFWDDTNNYLGIGTASPSTLLSLYNATNASLNVSSDTFTNIISARYSTNSGAPFMALRKGRGTTASPTAVASGDVLGQFIFQGYGGTNNRNLSQIVSYVDTYTSDSNISTGLYFGTSPSGSAASTENMRIDSSGNVGIGVTPATRLDVGGTGLDRLLINPQVAGSGVSLTAVNAANNAYSPYTTNGTVSIFQTGASERMRIDSSGNVGIGTSSPTVKLDVNGKINTRGDGVEGGEINFNNPDNASTGMTIDVAGADIGRIFSTRNNFALSLGQLSGTGGTITLHTAGSERMRIDSSGNVGIGATTLLNPGTPDAKTLTVSATKYPQIFSIATTAAANNTTYRTIARDTGVYQIQLINDAGTSEQTAYEISRSENSVGYQRWFGGTTEAMRIDSSGNVGIGTTSIGAATRLEVRSSNQITDARGIVAINSTNTAATNLGGSISFGGENGQATTPYNFGSIAGRYEGSGYLGYLQFSTTGAGGAVAERMRIDSSGNVGIGTSSPSAKLQVSGTAIIGASTSGAAQVALNTGGGTSTKFIELYYQSGSPSSSTTDYGHIQAGYQGSYWTNLALNPNGGNVGIGTSSPTNKLTVNGGIDFTGSSFSGSGTGIWQQTTNVLGFVTAGSNRVVIDATGNVGIGTNTPSGKLDVIGSIKALPAATQDAVIIAGRAGGTSSYSATLTPTTLTASRTITLPDTTTTMVGTDATQTLTNKTLTGAILNGTLGATTPSTVAATTGSFSGQLSVAQSTTLIGNGINLNASGSGYLRGTNNDASSSTQSNVQLMSWWGIGFSPSITGQSVAQGENAVWINARTGTLDARSTITAPTFIASNGLFVNATTLVASYTVASGQSAQSVGGTSGFTIPSGLSVTLSSGSRWVVL